MTFDKLKPLLEISDIDFYSIQVGSPSSQITGEKIIDLSAHLNDFSETAAAMENLDLIITTDTSVAHLAGTLGRPAWVLLGYSPDWRWGHEGTKSPWYSTVRLFRQKKDRKWESVINECKTSLCKISKSNNTLPELSKQF